MEKQLLLFQDGGKNQNPVSHTDCFGKIMGNQQGCFLCVPDNGADIVTNRQAGLIVQSGKRFVQKQKLWFPGPGFESKRPVGAYRRKAQMGGIVQSRLNHRSEAFLSALFGRCCFAFFGSPVREIHFHRWCAIQTDDPFETCIRW